MSNLEHLTDLFYNKDFDFDKVGFNGCLIYEASMWAKFVYKIKRSVQ